LNALLLAAVVLAGPSSDSQTERLVGLARVWGYVKYVHPAMATSSLDWDAALLRALPAVENATTDQAYRSAVAGLLAELGDEATHVVEEDPAEAARGVVSTAPGLRLEVVDARTAAIVIPNDRDVESTKDLQAEVCARFTDAARFERIVLDLRSLTGRRPGWILQNAIVKCAGRLLGEDVTLAPARFLTHGFYMMQGVSGGAGGGLGPWDSGLTVAGAGSVRAEGPRTPRLAFIVNRGTADLYALLMALQGDGLALVVQEGDVPAAGVMVTTFEVRDGLRVAVRPGERLRRDGSPGFVADAVVPAGGADLARGRALALLEAAPRDAAVSGPARVPYVAGAFVERDYSETPYPDRPHRLLALFRLYNAIEYFFPYKELMDRPWRETLAEFVPRLRDARDATDYALAVSELAVRIQDSHVTLESPVLDGVFGTHRPPVRVDRVEGLTVITELAPELSQAGLRVGDVALSVDGEESAARRARLGRYLPASTPGRLANKIDIQFLLGPRSKPAVIEVRGEDGTVRSVTVARTLPGLAPRSRTRSGPTYGLLPSGYAYVDLQRLGTKEPADAFETIRRTPGAILDMRGYPLGGAFDLVLRLARPGSPPSFLGGSIRYDGTTGTFSLEESPWTEEGPGGEPYLGPIVVLVDGSTQSAAEHVCALLKSTAAPTFVGSRTSGANGGVTRTILPGGIVVNFTGQSMRHRDGSRLQRVGIVPDVEAEPTLAGIRAGRDDLLERAIQLLDRARSTARP
jgi:C-terminal processing protease CtpA/Prc